MADTPTTVVCTDLIAAKGTKLWMSATAPTPFDVTGYDALTWTEIGAVESIGEFGPEASIGTYTPLGTGVACKFMGTTDNGELSLTIAKTDDTSLATYIGKQGDATSTAFKIELSNVGTTTPGHTVPAKHLRYMFMGLVKSAKVSIGTGDDVVKITSSIVLNGAFVEGAPADSAA